MAVWVLGVYRVRDVEAAVASYEQSREIRRRAGQKSYQVFRVDNAPEGESKIAVLGDWDDPADFQAFRGTPEFRQIMEGLGVIGAPEVTVLTQLVPPEAAQE